MKVTQEFEQDIKDMLDNARAIKGDAFFHLIQLISCLRALSTLIEPGPRFDAVVLKAMSGALASYQAATKLSDQDLKEAVNLYETMFNLTIQHKPYQQGESNG